MPIETENHVTDIPTVENWLEFSQNGHTIALTFPPHIQNEYGAHGIAFEIKNLLHWFADSLTDPQFAGRAQRLRAIADFYFPAENEMDDVGGQMYGYEEDEQE